MVKYYVIKFDNGCYRSSFGLTKELRNALIYKSLKNAKDEGEWSISFRKKSKPNTYKDINSYQIVEVEIKEVEKKLANIDVNVRLKNAFIAGAEFAGSIEHTNNVREQALLGAMFYLNEITFEELEKALQKYQK